MSSQFVSNADVILGLSLNLKNHMTHGCFPVVVPLPVVQLAEQ